MVETARETAERILKENDDAFSNFTPIPALNKLAGDIADAIAEIDDELLRPQADAHPAAGRKSMKPQPIESAPRDGTEIIGIWQDATEQDYAALMRWVKATDWMPHEDGERDGWWGYVNSLTQIEYADDADIPIKAPTHWLPYENPFRR